MPEDHYLQPVGSLRTTFMVRTRQEIDTRNKYTATTLIEKLMKVRKFSLHEGLMFQGLTVAPIMTARNKLQDYSTYL